VKNGRCRIFGRNLCQDGVAAFDDAVDIGLAKAERRPDLQDIAIGARRTDQHPAFAQAVDHGARHFGHRRLGFSVCDEFGADEQARAAHVANVDMAVADLSKARAKMPSYDAGVLDEVFVPDPLQHRKPRCGSEGIAAE